MRSFSRHARWGVPAAAVAAVAAVTAGSLISSAAAAPALPPRTPAQLLAAVAGATSPPPPFTGQVDETASLGLPQLPGADNQNSITSLLTGSHSMTVFYGGPKKLRLQVPVPMGESDFIRNGTTGWLWRSSSNSVTKFTIPAHKAAGGALPAPAPTATPLTPQQAAQQVLAAVGKNTAVAADSNTTVASQPVYRLVLTPKQSGSLVGRVVIALDGAHPQLPMQVQVFASNNSKTPAFQVGFNSFQFVTPAATNFNFTPPKGATVHTATPGSKTGTRPSSPLAAKPQVIGKDWLSVAVLPASVLSGLSGGSAASAAGQAAQSAAGSGSGPSSAAVMGALLKSARQVTYPGGSGKLLQTSLLSVLITNNGHVLAGAVTPSVLEAAAGQVK